MSNMPEAVLPTPAADVPSTPRAIDVRAFIDARGMSSRQWLLLVLCMLLVVADGMDVAIMGFLVPAIGREWQVSHEVFGIVLGAAPVGLAVGSLLVGPQADRYGRKRVLLASVLLFGLFSVAASRAGSIAELAVLRFIAGVGLGATMPCTTTLLSEYVPTRSRSLLITCMFTGFNLGSALIGFIAAAVIPAHGWRTVLVIGGCLPLAALPFYWRWLPESARFMVVRGASSERIARTLGWVCRSEIASDAGFVSHEPQLPPKRRVTALLQPAYRGTTLALWAAYFMGLVVIYLFSSWMPSLITASGQSIEHAANVTALFQLGGTVGAILVGFAMDRRLPQRVIAVAYLGGAAAALLLGALQAASALFVAVVVVAGFCISGAQTGLNAHAPACYPTGIRATGVSWMLGIGRFGSIFGSMIGGVLLTAGWGAATILAALAVPGVLAAVAAWGGRAAPEESPWPR